MNTRKAMIFAVAVFAVVFFASESALGQSQSKVRRATWQTSVDDSQRGVVTLGLRDKWGTLGRFTATFVVRQGRNSYTGRMASTGDEWAYIDFPSQFPGRQPPAGSYKVTFYVSGVVVGSDSFRFRR